MINVTFNLHKPLGDLEFRKGRLGYKKIADKTGISPQGVRRLLTESTRQIDIETIAKLLTWLRDEGLPVTIDDLFTVTQEPRP